MTTVNMIYILRCPTKDKNECKYCFCKNDCDSVIFRSDPHNWPKEIAGRLEQLLVYLRSTKEQNDKLSSDVTYWKHRYETLLEEVNKITREQEILNKNDN